MRNKKILIIVAIIIIIIVVIFFLNRDKRYKVQISENDKNDYVISSEDEERLVDALDRCSDNFNGEIDSCYNSIAISSNLISESVQYLSNLDVFNLNDVEIYDKDGNEYDRTQNINYDSNTIRLISGRNYLLKYICNDINYYYLISFSSTGKYNLELLFYVVGEQNLDMNGMLDGDMNMELEVE